MLHYSLYTLFGVIGKNPSYDIVVFLKSSDNSYSFDSIHLDKFNLKKDFPNVIFVESDYDKKDAYMSKWYHFQKTFEMGYEKVFYFDVDTVFFKDPDFLFEKYSDDYFWCLFEGMNSFTKKLLGHRGINSGHFLMHKKLFDKVPNFFETITEKRIQLSNLAKDYFKKDIINKKEENSFNYFNEQYCLQETLNDLKIPLEEIDRVDMNWGHDIVEVIRENDDVVGYKNKTYTVWHYTTFYSYLILPKRYFTSYIKMKYENSNKN